MQSYLHSLKLPVLIQQLLSQELHATNPLATHPDQEAVRPPLAGHNVEAYMDIECVHAYVPIKRVGNYCVGLQLPGTRLLEISEISEVLILKTFASTGNFKRPSPGLPPTIAAISHPLLMLTAQAAASAKRHFQNLDRYSLCRHPQPFRGCVCFCSILAKVSLLTAYRLHLIKPRGQQHYSSSFSQLATHLLQTLGFAATHL